jgi:hypothetical protein
LKSDHIHKNAQVAERGGKRRFKKVSDAVEKWSLDRIQDFVNRKA